MLCGRAPRRGGRTVFPAGVLRRLGSADGGDALVLVIGSMAVLTLIVMTAIGATMSGMKYARQQQDAASALSAAQSGIDELLARLNADPTYLSTSVDCANIALRAPGADARACGWASQPVGWVPVVAGADVTTQPAYHYAVDQTNRATQGRVTITSTGRSRGVYKTIQAVLGQKSSADYVYYTDFEDADPTNTAVYPNWNSYSDWQKTACGGNGYGAAIHWWELYNGDRTKPRSAAGCVEIQFVGGDVIHGKILTNDTIFSTAQNGLVPVFQQLVTTATPTCDTPGTTNASWQTACLRSGSVADFSGKTPMYTAPQYMDDTAVQFQTSPGCHYVGATRIKFSGTSMQVWNLAANNGGTAPQAIAPTNGSAPSCGTGTNINGQTIPIPQNMVVYVGDSTAATGQCATGAIDAGTLPLAGDTLMSDPNKFCSKGSLYVEGSYSGAVTLATSQSTVVTGDLVRANGTNGTDMLGIVAQNSVEVFHPVNSQGNEIQSTTWPKRYTDPDHGAAYPTHGIQIAAAIQTLQHSFTVQNYNQGNGSGLGTLTVVGSIAQRWRGIVGQSGSSCVSYDWLGNCIRTQSATYGYLKDYSYNSNLSNVLPPYMPRWKGATWDQKYSADIPTPAAVTG